MFLKSRIFNISPQKLQKYAKNVVTNFYLIFVEKCDNSHNILNYSNLVSLTEWLYLSHLVFKSSFTKKRITLLRKQYFYGEMQGRTERYLYILMRSRYGTCLENYAQIYHNGVNFYYQGWVERSNNYMVQIWSGLPLYLFPKMKKTSNELTQFRNLIDRYTSPITSTTGASAVA